MIIAHPIFDTKATRRALTKYVSLYNKDKEIGKRVRDTQINLFMQLASILRYDFITNNENCEKTENEELKAINIDDVPPITATNKFLVNNTGINRSTVWRRVNRLIEAGLIYKVSHGHEKRYDLYLNNFIIAICDAENKENRLKPNPKAAIKYISSVADCNYIKVFFGNTCNNIIIHRKESDKSDNSLMETRKDTLDGNT